jgi:tight adherence protein B
MRSFDNSLPDAIDMIQRMLRAGLSRQSAFEGAAEKAKEPVKSEFKIVVNRMRRGASEREELTKLADRVPTPDLRIFVTAMLVQGETGSPDFPEVLERLTDMIRVRIELQAEMKSNTAQGRLSGVMLACIPVAMMGMMKIINPSYLDPLFNDPRGHYMLAYSIISDVVGTLIIRRITTLEA